MLLPTEKVCNHYFTPLQKLQVFLEFHHLPFFLYVAEHSHNVHPVELDDVSDDLLRSGVAAMPGLYNA